MNFRSSKRDFKKEKRWIYWNVFYLDDNAKLDSEILYAESLHDFLSVCKILTVGTHTFT